MHLNMINNFKLRLVNYNIKYNCSLNDILYYYDFTFVFSGELCYIFDGVPKKITAGSGVFLPPGHHRIRKPVADHDKPEYMSINFFTDEVFNFPLIMHDCVTPLVKLSLDTILTIYNSYAANIEERIELEIKQLIYSLQELTTSNTPLPKVKYENQKIQAITSYIDTHLTEKLSLGKIAQHVSLTPSYCATLMKRETGISVFDYIIKGRMELANDYILKSEKSLMEIAEICGYSNYCYFSKHFKRIIGCSPSKLKK